MRGWTSLNHVLCALARRELDAFRAALERRGRRADPLLH